MVGCSPPDVIANAAAASNQRSSRRRPTGCCDQIYASLYNFPDHTNLGAGGALQNKRKPLELNFALGAYRFASEAANTGRWNGEILTWSYPEDREGLMRDLGHAPVRKERPHQGRHALCHLRETSFNL